MQTSTPRLLAHREGPIGFIVFDHQQRRNAMSRDMWQALPEALEALEADPAVRVLLLSGAGQHAFVSGADISEFDSARASWQAEQQYSRECDGALLRLQAVAKPTIAMIRGYCIGGGMAIALSCDLRIAAEDARFGIPAARLGLGYGFDGVRALTDVVGPAHAKEILFIGRQLGARDALRIGLVNQVTDSAELHPIARATATHIAENAPLTIRASKLAIDELRKDPEQRDLARVNAAVAQCFDSADYAEGCRAFREKRRPRFEGR